MQALKLENIKLEIIQILQSHSPYGDVQVIFFRGLLEFKMAAMDELHNFLWAQKLKSEIIHILLSQYPPSGNVQVILLKFKMATTSQLFKYLGPQKLLT